MNSTDILAACGLEPADLARGDLAVATPIDGSEIARLDPVSPARLAAMIAAGAEAFRKWREVPAPRRGELVRLLGEELRPEKRTSVAS